MTNHWSPPTAAPAAAPAAPVPGHPLPVAHPTAYPIGYPAAYAPQPDRPRASRTAVAALVVACIALTGVVTTALVAVVPMLFVGGTMSGGGVFPEEEYELLGTLPGAQAEQQYPDDLLVAEVERTLEADWSTYSGIVCEPLGVLEEGASTSCTGTVDGVDEELDLVVEDDLGHFTLTYFW